MMVANMYLDQVSVDVTAIREKKMSDMFTKSYMTVDEFANLVTQTVYECGYFKPEDRNHPEDIEAAFTTVATAVARGATYATSKMVKNNYKITINTNTI